MNPATGRQRLAGRTDVDIPPAVEPELGPRECAVIPPTHILYGDVRDDARAGDKGQEFARPVGRVGHEPLGAELEA